MTSVFDLVGAGLAREGYLSVTLLLDVTASSRASLAPTGLRCMRIWSIKI